MSDQRILFFSTFLRAVATGMLGVLLGLYLAHLHFVATAIGLTNSAGLAGATAAVLLATFAGDRVGRRRTLVVLAAMAAAGGIGAILFDSLGALLAVAVVGMLNGQGRDRGAALVIEQAMLPATATGPVSSRFLPSIVRAVAANGNIYGFGGGMLLPSPSGAFEVLAQGSIFGNALETGLLTTPTSGLATPFRPGWATLTDGASITASNYWGDYNAVSDQINGGQTVYSYGRGGQPFVFDANTVKDRVVPVQSDLSRIYAVNDITSVTYGRILTTGRTVAGAAVNSVYYQAARPLQMLAGGDIVSTNGLILHTDINDVSTIAAGGSIIYAGWPGNDSGVNRGWDIAGPGTLEITAAKNIYQGSTATVESIGALAAGGNRPQSRYSSSMLCLLWRQRKRIRLLRQS